MIIEIMSDSAVAQIETNGAELQSLKDVFNTEYIWQGDPKYWNRRAPVLFPIVGAQKNGEYEYNGKTYKISRHGFARDSEFELVASNKNSAVFSLSSSDYTRTIYPFDFRLLLEYTLEGAQLTVKYSVLNTGNEDMYFSIGDHTAFNCPLLEDEKFEDYCVEFERDEHIDRLLINEDGLFTGEKEPFLNDRSFRLDHSIFDKDVVFSDNLNSKAVSLINQKTGRGVSVEYKDFDNLGIWSPKGDAPFVCFEPWNGRASSVNDSAKLTDKKGIIRLSSGCHHDFTRKIILL